MQVRRVLNQLPKKRPHFILPMQCKLVAELPAGRDWVYEVKWDGFRALCIKDGKQVQLISRKEKPLSAKYPEIVDAMNRLAIKQIVVDGEIVAIDENGAPSFQLLQKTRSSETQILFYAFDLLNLEGRETIALPLHHRKKLLRDILGASISELRFSANLDADRAVLIEAVRTQGFEGLVAKRHDSLYEPGLRSGSWVKFKTESEQEFVIGGFRPSGKTQDFDLLFVGYFTPSGELRYAAKVRAGFTPYLKRLVRERLRKLETKKCPFVNVHEGKGGRWGENLTVEDLQTSIWLKPQAVCQVRFTEWTSGGHLRHPVFIGLRDDKDAREVVREGSVSDG